MSTSPYLYLSSKSQEALQLVVDHKPQEAVELLSNSSNPEELCVLGFIRVEGCGLGCQHKFAYETFKRASEIVISSSIDFPIAHLFLAYCHAASIGTKKDLTSAKALILKAVSTGFRFSLKPSTNPLGALIMAILNRTLPQHTQISGEKTSEDLLYYAAKHGVCFAYAWIGTTTNPSGLDIANIKKGCKYQFVSALCKHAFILGDKGKYSKALATYQTAADQNYATAMNNLGYIFYNGRGTPVNYQLALKYYTISSSMGNTYSDVNIADMYRDGIGVEKDIDKAIFHYELAAAEDNTTALSSLGWLCENIISEPQRAAIYYQRAVDLGDSMALNNLGLMYENGVGVPQDFKKAVEYFTKAAKMGNQYAQSNLASLYERGKGVLQNYTKALEFYTLSANQGNAVAQSSLGLMYELGRGTNVDPVKSFNYYTAAAEKENGMALTNLGLMYYNGSNGINQDYQKALGYYKRGAAIGNKWCENNLGVMFMHGYGMDKPDYYEAARHLKSSASKNYDFAVSNLTRLENIIHPRTAKSSASVASSSGDFQLPAPQRRRRAIF